MSQSNVYERRRKVINLANAEIAIVPSSTLLIQRVAWSESSPHRSEDDPTAKALGNVHDAANAPSGKRKEDRLARTVV